MMRAVLVITFVTVLPAMAQDGVQFFEESVRPVLRANCLACHSDKMLTSGLSLETRESIVRGGNRGGKPEVLLNAIRHSGDLKMPPGRKLKDEQIAALREVGGAGLADAGNACAVRRRPGSDHWAFQAPRRRHCPR